MGEEALTDLHDLTHLLNEVIENNVVTSVPKHDKPIVSTVIPNLALVERLTLAAMTAAVLAEVPWPPIPANLAELEIDVTHLRGLLARGYVQESTVERDASVVLAEAVEGLAASMDHARECLILWRAEQQGE